MRNETDWHRTATDNENKDDRVCYLVRRRIVRRSHLTPPKWDGELAKHQMVGGSDCLRRMDPSDGRMKNLS